MPARRTYARLEDPEPVEVRVHPGFVTWAGRDYAVVARADDPHPNRPTWRVIASTGLVGAQPDAAPRRPAAAPRTGAAKRR